MLGARIEELRDARKLTRLELAEMLNVDARQIAAYELNGMWPGPEMAAALTKAFQIELRDLYDLTPTRIVPSLSIEERLASRVKRKKLSRRAMPDKIR